MLSELHVRNLALIEKADLELKEGLTILSGETGAGKSILIDSINVALGAKTGKGIIRTGAEYAYIELVFIIDDAEKLEKIRELEVEPDEGGLLIISRKITPARSTAKINDETVTASKLRALTGLLIDMHGQFEHQSLMYASSHLEFIDKLSPAEALGLKEEIKNYFREYQETDRLLSEGIDSALREREADILRYEIDEIEKAQLKEGEEEELYQLFRRMKNSSRISELLSDALRQLDTDSISRAARSVSEAAGCDSGLADLKEELDQIDGMLQDAERSLNDYAESMEFDAQRFSEVEERLDIIHRLQGKYGDAIDQIMTAAQQKKERLSFLENYDARRTELIKRKAELNDRLRVLCDRLSAIRQDTAETLRPRIEKELKDLNFQGVDFRIDLERTGRFSENGDDSAQFLISTNPGHPVKPLGDVASGGELSRIMLALKTVLADTDEIDTLVFDEIDAGISGRTAQAVAEKLSIIGREHQVLCITHLPQIAAMADNHYLIEKSTDGESTRTDIMPITDADVTVELARMMGGSEITDSVLKAAEEMKKLADEVKK